MGFILLCAIRYDDVLKNASIFNFKPLLQVKIQVPIHNIVVLSKSGEKYALIKDC